MDDPCKRELRSSDRMHSKEFAASESAVQFEIGWLSLARTLQHAVEGMRSTKWFDWGLRDVLHTAAIKYMPSASAARLHEHERPAAARMKPVTRSICIVHLESAREHRDGCVPSMHRSSLEVA